MLLYFRSAKTLRNSASAFTVFRGTRKLATIDGADVTEHGDLSAEERQAVHGIAGAKTEQKRVARERGLKAARTRRERLELERMYTLEDPRC